ncbi:MAG: cobalamin biosynthesis protein [Crenarchaeota archaeon]|nr:cobalamin biosynthesis protein [Thermoproteota archaeon]
MISKISIIFSIILMNTIIIDLLNGEVRDKVCPIHPVVICWKIGSFLLNRVQKTRTGGVVLWICTVIPLLFIYALFPTMLLIYFIESNIIYIVIIIIIISMINKFTISLKLLNWYYLTILQLLENNEAKARILLQEIVRRDVFALDRDHVISALVETYVESLVDGLVSTLFWFSLLGLVGSYLQRLSNTMDSLVGYKHDPYRDVGWFSANVDTILNIPGSILFSIFLLISSYRRGIFREFLNNLKSSINVTSINARLVFAAASTVLRVDLEKPCEYRVGNYGIFPSIHHCRILFRSCMIAISLCIVFLVLLCILTFSLVS